LSPEANVREDEYGRDRPRFLLELLDAIRARCGPAFVIGVRLNGDDEDVLAVVRRLDVDLLSVSAGTHAAVAEMVGDWSLPAGNLVRYAARVRETAAGTPVVAAGRILEPAQAEQILERGDADLVGLTRALLADPDWPRRAARGQPARIRPCIGCNE